MYKLKGFHRTRLNVNESLEGETLETKIERIVNNKEAVKDGAPLIYTERQEGIKASTNIRTDRFEIAIDAMDKVAKSYKARREESGKVIELNKKKDGEAEPTQGNADL